MKFKREDVGGWIIILVLVLSICIPGFLQLHAQTIGAKPGQLDHLLMVGPSALPTSSTCLVGTASSCIQQITTTTIFYLCDVDMSASGSAITIKDGQATPIPWYWNGQALGSMGTPGGFTWDVSRDGSCRPFPYGIYVQGASGATGSFTIKY